MSSEDLLRGFGLTEGGLEAPFTRVPMSTLCSLMEHARELTGEPGFGFYLGLGKRATMYGYLGFAAMNAANLGAAIELAIRYAPSIGTGVALRQQTEQGLASLVIEEKARLGRSRDIVLISLGVGLSTIAHALTGRDTEPVVELAIPEPEYYPRFAAQAPRMRFDAPISQIIWPAEALELPLVAADRAAMRLAQEHCEQEMRALGLVGNVVERIHRLMLRPGGPESFDDVAQALRMSPRTLRRKLTAQGVNFSTLRARVCCERATVLLRSREISLEAVAHQLGYASLSGFVRAFQRWTGQTPAAYRRDRLREAGQPEPEPDPAADRGHSMVSPALPPRDVQAR